VVRLSESLAPATGAAWHSTRLGGVAVPIIRVQSIENVEDWIELPAELIHSAGLLGSGRIQIDQLGNPDGKLILVIGHRHGA